MSSPKTIFKNLFSLTAAEFSSRFLSVIYSVYLARVLLVDGFGIFGASKNFTLFFMLFASLGLDAIGTREVAKNPMNIRKIVNNILTIRVLFSLFVYLLLLITVVYINKSYTEKIVILIFGFNILANNSLLNWAYQGMERMNVFAIRTILVNVLNFLGIILFVHSPTDLTTSAIVVSFTLVFNSLWMIFLYQKDYGRIKFDFDFKYWKDLLKQGIPIGLTFFIIGIYNYQGVVLLNFLSSSYSAGLYNAAFNVLMVATILSTILQAVYFPIFSKNVEFENKKKVFSQYSRMTFLVGTYIPFFLFVFADKVILFFGKNYSDSMVAIRLLMIAVLFIYYNITFFSPLLAWKYEKKVIYANLTGAIVNLLVNLLLIPRFAENGAAISAFLSEFSVFIVLSIIFFPIFRSLFVGNYLKYFFLSLVSTLPFLFFRFESFYNILLMVLSFGIFIALNFLFKTVNLNEFKVLLKKNEI